MPRLALAPLLLVVVLAACGGGADDPPPRPSFPSADAVIRGWAEDLRRGDVDAATDRFAVPAIVANGTPPQRLETRAEVRVFNDTLPCGGRVLSTDPHHGVVIATFELTDRVGGDCGSGAGNRAKAAFEIRRGKIVRWLRVPTGGEPDQPRGPVV